MPEYWNFSWWWCLVPMLFMFVAAGAFMFFMSRRGGCGCMGASSRGGQGNPPRNSG